jgi:hypothetical protein
MTANLHDAIIRAFADRLEQVDADSPAAVAIVAEIAHQDTLRAVFAEMDRRRAGWSSGLPHKVHSLLPIM